MSTHGKKKGNVELLSMSGFFKDNVYFDQTKALFKDEFGHTTLAADVMQPQRNQPLDVITQDKTTLSELQDLMKYTEHNGFPVVVSK